MQPNDTFIASAGQPLVSVVVIGRNEGERLGRCLASIAAMDKRDFRIEVIYVDSASTDGSPARAADLGASVIEVHPERPSAALGRNAGWRAARGDYVLFLDADTLLHPEFVRHALAAMANQPRVAVVWGHRREAHPGQSLYVRVLDLDWVYPPGPSEICGGDALMRRAVLEQVDGFDPSLIAGEEPELCRRIRGLDLTIQHLDIPMTRHDLAITRFTGYWKRALRAGHAYAEVSSRFADSPDPLWQRDARRNLWHGSLLLTSPLALLAALVWPWLWVPLLIGGLLLLGRSVSHCAWKTDSIPTRLLYALHSHFQQLPILIGQIRYHLDQARGRRRGVIEYKLD